MQQRQQALGNQPDVLTKQQQRAQPHQQDKQTFDEFDTSHRSERLSLTTVQINLVPERAHAEGYSGQSTTRGEAYTYSEFPRLRCAYHRNWRDFRLDANIVRRVTGAQACENLLYF